MFRFALGVEIDLHMVAGGAVFSTTPSSDRVFTVVEPIVDVVFQASDAGPGDVNLTFAIMLGHNATSGANAFNLSMNSYFTGLFASILVCDQMCMMITGNATFIHGPFLPVLLNVCL